MSANLSATDGTAAPVLPSRLNLLEIVGNAIVGGMETCVLRLIERLPRERVNVTVMCPFESRFTDHLRALDVEVLVASMPEDPPWASIQMAASLIKTRAIDVVHAHMANAHVLAALAGKLTGKPVLSTIHGRQLHNADLEVHRAAGTHLSVVCAHTYYHALGLGVNPAQLTLIPNGVDVNVFTPRQRETTLRERFGIPADAPVAGFLGRLSWEKGPDVFLRAVLGAHQRVPDAHFILVGEGPMLSQLQDFARQFGLAGHVHFAGLQTDIPAVLSEFDLLVSSSHSEAMPLAIMEAMACGVPVLATRAGGVPDLIQHGITGWMVGLNDYEALAREITRLLSTDKERQAMGAAARQRAVERFSLADRVAETEALLQRLAQPAAATRRIAAMPSQPRALAGSNGASRRPSGKAAPL
jgi:glycosyltransferase involved in cell wall biosynthesis